MQGGVWLAILVTVVASTSCSVGKALQKEATRLLPRFSTERKILIQYLQSRTWLAGVAADVGGGVLQILAFALAPVSLVQPVSGVGLVGLALYSNFVLQERLQAWEWAAVAVAGAGTAGLGASSAGAAPEAPPGAARMIGTLAVASAGVATISALRQQQHRRLQKRRQPVKPSPAGYGLQAGACFGLSAASCRIGFLLAPRSVLWAPLGLAGSVLLSSSGFLLQTCGLKEGSTVVVCTCAAVAAMVCGVLVGLVGLAEALPASRAAAALRLASWAAVVGGVAALAGGAGGAKELAAAALARMPSGAYKAMPVGAAVRLRGWAAVLRAELPMHGQAEREKPPAPGHEHE